MKPELINKAVSEHSKSVDRLAKLVRVATTTLERELQKQGILCRVSGRVKSPDSLKSKLEKYALNPKKAKRLKSPTDVFSEIGDLAAIRVMTYLEVDRAKVAEIAKRFFAHRPGHPDFEFDEKENDKRIKGDPHNFYRATHMQICVRPDQLRGENENLRGDHCELQITSMLAHVWNEVEHDIVYKGDKLSLSKQERSAIESLGLLTKSGDNIIESLIYANRSRLAKRLEMDAHKNSRFSDKIELSEFLHRHYGRQVAGVEIDFDKNSAEFLRTLQCLDMDHPKYMCEHFSPSHMCVSYDLSLKVEEHRGVGGKNSFDRSSCDVFIVASLTLDSDLTRERLGNKNGNYREVSFFKSLNEMEVL